MSTHARQPDVAEDAGHGREPRGGHDEAVAGTGARVLPAAG